MAVSCYIYGAPRTGNHAFANELVQQVPDTWAVINDQDLGAHQACCYCRGLDRQVAAHFDLAFCWGSCLGRAKPCMHACACATHALPSSRRN